MTPMQQQYNEMKQQHSDALLLFRMGDFYECFNEDAEVAARVLGITLTARGKTDDGKTPMAGIPYHALGNYLPKLLKAGIKVALAEQTEEPQPGKLVNREVVKVFTPGTTVDEKTLDPNINNYLASIFITNSKSKIYGISFVDLSTGELKVFETTSAKVAKDELTRIAPQEVICTIAQYEEVLKISPLKPQQRDQTPFQFEKAYDQLNSQFGTVNLKGFGIDNLTCAISALGGLLSYMQDCQRTELKHLKSISIYQISDYMHLDASTLSNLEIIYSNSGNHKYTLLSVLDNCISAMGKRKLRNWVLRPYKIAKPITARLDTVDYLHHETITNDNIRNSLGHVYDIERILSRVGLGSANARDLLSLGRSLDQIDDLVSILDGKELPGKLQEILEVFTGTNEAKTVKQLIDNSIHPEPPVNITEGNIIADGYNAQVDEFRSLTRDSKQILAEVQAREITASGISSLRIGFNKVFGYYIEITKTHASKVPAHYVRKQTLANAERYITDELKQLEEKILNAEEQLMQLEYQLFCDVRTTISENITSLLAVANAIAELDVLSNFAYLARQNRFVKPEFTSEQTLEIEQGRHPVVEKVTAVEFTPNNIHFDQKKNLMILTGPNMSGKSTYIRQVALLTFMAQIGMFVPATSMRLKLVDRIFTRVGASDNLAAGESTFMVEMNETANILNNATKDSLIILDEVGRGTSTYDGVAIAWSLVEYLHEQIGANTLFATHYHELIQLDQKLSRVINYQVTVDESSAEIAFTHHIKPGSTSKSYGIHVAKLAGVPSGVTQRAEQILKDFEADNKPELQKQSATKIKKSPTRPRKISPQQLGLI